MTRWGGVGAAESASFQASVAAFPCALVAATLPITSIATQVFAVGENRFEQREALHGSHQNANVAIPEYVGDLLRLEERIDRNEDRAGSRGAEYRLDRLEPLFEKDGDARGALQAEMQICARNPVDCLGEPAISQVVLAVA